MGPAPGARQSPTNGGFSLQTGRLRRFRDPKPGGVGPGRDRPECHQTKPARLQYTRTSAGHWLVRICCRLLVNGPSTAVGRTPTAARQPHRCHRLSGWPPRAQEYPCVTFRRVVVSLRGPGQSPVLPFACCVGSLCSVSRCGRCSAGVVSAFAEPSGWCTGAVLDVVGCAVCASAAPSSWRIGGCAGCCGGRLTVFAVHVPLSTHRSPCPPLQPPPPPNRETVTWPQKHRKY